MDYSAEQIRKLASEGEGATLEYKTGPPDTMTVARLISAFANTDGGVLLVGVGPRGEIVGTDGPLVQQNLNRALTAVVSPPPVDFRTVDVDGKQVAVVSVGKSDQVIVSNVGAFRRVGESTKPLEAVDISARLRKQGLPEDKTKEMAAGIAQLTETVLQLQEDISHANSWKSQLVNHLISGAIGAILGAILTALLGG